MTNRNELTLCKWIDVQLRRCNPRRHFSITLTLYTHQLHYYRSSGHMWLSGHWFYCVCAHGSLSGKFPADVGFPCDRVFCRILQTSDCKYGEYGYRFIYAPKWNLSFIAAFYIKIYVSKFSCMKICVNTFLRVLLVSKTQSVIDEKRTGTPNHLHGCSS